MRLRCVKGARIPISKDRLPIDAGATVYLVAASNRKQLCNTSRIGSFVVAFLREVPHRPKPAFIILVAKSAQSEVFVSVKQC